MTSGPAHKCSNFLYLQYPIFLWYRLLDYPLFDDKACTYIPIVWLLLLLWLLRLLITVRSICISSASILMWQQGIDIAQLVNKRLNYKWKI